MSAVCVCVASSGRLPLSLVAVGEIRLWNAEHMGDTAECGSAPRAQCVYPTQFGQVDFSGACWGTFLELMFQFILAITTF